MAKGKKVFKIESPRGEIVVSKTAGGTLTSRLVWAPGFQQDHQQKFSSAQAFVDSECIRCMAPETPRRSGALIRSATLGTTIGSGEINQIAPYARRQYYEHKQKNYWFERMKNRHKDRIVKGAQAYL